MKGKRGGSATRTWGSQTDLKHPWDLILEPQALPLRAHTLLLHKWTQETQDTMEATPKKAEGSDIVTEKGTEAKQV